MGFSEPAICWAFAINFHKDKVSTAQAKNLGNALRFINLPSQKLFFFFGKDKKTKGKKIEAVV
jgi:hypothetical protein